MADSQIEKIKERLDILEVAKSYIGNFQKRGANYFALCPFHHEKTPSFSVNPEMGIFKCFGCGESGDCLTLIQKMEGVEFPKALEIAAKRAGVELKRGFSKQEEKRYKEKQQILELNALTTEYYHYILTKHNLGAKGREYAKKRKLTKELIKKFQIGYAPQNYTNLLKFLKTKNYSLANLVKWGVIVSRNGRAYDKFRNRLIFPLINRHSDIIGFSGRLLPDENNNFSQKAPKYLHSPQTLIFDKSGFLFGLEQAKTEIRKKDFAVFCEGQLDVISSHKTKVRNIVATLGTSLTEAQLALAGRYTKNIYFCFDNDLAGETALIKSSSLAYKQNLNVKTIFIEKGKDADELINTDKYNWENAVKNAEPMIEQMIRRLSTRLDTSKLNKKEQFASIILPIIANMGSKIGKTHYLHKVAVILNIDEGVLQNEIASMKTKSSLVPKVNISKFKKLLRSPTNVQEEYLLALAFQHVQFLKASLKICRIKYFLSPAAKTIFSKLKTYEKKKQRFSLKNFATSLDNHEVPFFKNLLLKNLKGYFKVESEFCNEIRSIVGILKKNALKNNIRRIKTELEKAEALENKQQIKTLLKKLAKITQALSKVEQEQSTN